MSATGNGTSTYLATVGVATVSATNYSVSLWYKPTHVPNTSGGTTVIYSLTAGGGTTYNSLFTWDNPSSALFKSWQHKQSAGGTLTVQLIGTPAASVWHHFMVTWDGTTLRLYWNGVLNNSVTGTNPSPGIGSTITCLAYNAGASGFIDGSLANVCVWNLTITAANALDMGAGQTATNISAGSILWYDPLMTGTPTPIGTALTNHGTTINQAFFAPGLSGGSASGGTKTTAGVAYHVGMSGGSASGGTKTIGRVNYRIGVTGGSASGGALTTASVHRVITMTGGSASGGNKTGAKASYTITMHGGSASGGTMQAYQTVSNGAIVIGTNREVANTTV